MNKLEKWWAVLLVVVWLGTTLFFVLMFLTGCQATPEEPIVIGKNNDGWDEKALEEDEIIELNIPGYYEKELRYDGITIRFRAEVECPEEQTYPVYVLEKKTFTQEDADRIREALIGDVVLYDIVNGRTKELVREEIEYYNRELDAATKDGHEDIAEIYRDILKDLMTELETAPDEEIAQKSDTALHFNRNAEDLWEYAEIIVHEDETGEWQEAVWTEEALKEGKDAGNTEVTGYCIMPNGTQKLLSIKNRADTISTVYFGVEDGAPVVVAKGGISEEQARKIAGELLDKIGIEYEILSCWKYTKPGEYYMVNCSRIVDGASRGSVVHRSDLILGGEYDAGLHQESITVCVDADGILSFRWEAPISIRTAENENVRLLPWEEVSAIIEKGLKVKELPYLDEENVVDRRLEVEKIVLHYMQIPKEADHATSYYVPVWDVIGKMVCIYADDYDPQNTEGGGFLVDENNERIEYENESVITINAIDGTIVR